MHKLLKRLGLFIAAPFFVVILYLAAAFIGGIIPASKNETVNSTQSKTKRIFLTANALHADIAIPVDDAIREKFTFLQDAGFPLDNPGLEYLIIGWGSREFYTNTAQYSDMEFGTIWRAATGDAAALHIAPGGDISKSEGVMPIIMTQAGFDEMIDFMLGSLQLANQKPDLIEGATFGYGDLFYEAKGRFNIFNPCNVWVSQALNTAGVSAGIWTPTTYSLRLHHKLYIETK